MGISIATGGLHKRESTLRSRGYASLIVLLVGLGSRGATMLPHAYMGTPRFCERFRRIGWLKSPLITALIILWLPFSSADGVFNRERMHEYVFAISRALLTRPL